MTRNDRAFARAQRVMPGGVSSPVRAFRSVGGTPRVIARAHGAHLVDVDGHEYIDYIGGWGATICGHATPSITRAIVRAVRRGTTFGTASCGEARLARVIIDRVPGLDMVRFSNSGTEAVMTAIRLARAATGRSLIVKCEGCYHGHADAMLARSGSGVATLGLPESPGVLEDAARSTITVPFNDLAASEEVFRRHAGRVAAFVLEPCVGNMGVVPPAPGYLAALRELTRAHGSLLVFDEVMSGFRVGAAGMVGVAGVTPDLVTYGKVIGGGMPVGAVAGPGELLSLLAPTGPVYAAGTFSGNPVTMAAGCAALELLDHRAYEHLDAHARRLHNGLRTALDALKVRGCVQRCGSMLSVFFGVDAVRSMQDARRADHTRFARLFSELLARGVHLPPSGYEAWFLSLAHDDTVVDATTTAFTEALAATLSDSDFATTTTHP